MGTVRRVVTGAVVAAVVAAVAIVPATPAVAKSAARSTGKPAAKPKYAPITTLLAGEIAALFNPAGSPAGVNVAKCALTAAHPRPLILINGTSQVMLSSFGYLGPQLANAGYCVYGFNYGGDPTSAIQAIGPVLDGVKALATEVSAVRKATGSKQVDLVGYSQGGLISEYYTKFNAKGQVHSVVALAPTTHGTTLSGLATLGQVLGLIGFVGQLCAACADQVTGSAVVTALSKGPIAQAGVAYTVVETQDEEVVTPVGSSFIDEPGVVNEYVQSLSPSDKVEHLGLVYDPTVLKMTLTALAKA